MFTSCDQLQQATLHHILPGGAPGWGIERTMSRLHVDLFSHTKPIPTSQVICLQAIVEELASPGGERHFVGKRGGAKSARQEDINKLLVRLCQEVGSGQPACSDSIQAAQQAQERMPQRPAPPQRWGPIVPVPHSICTSDLHENGAPVLQLLAGSSCD